LPDLFVGNVAVVPGIWNIHYTQSSAIIQRRLYQFWHNVFKYVQYHTAI